MFIRLTFNPLPRGTNLMLPSLERMPPRKHIVLQLSSINSSWRVITRQPPGPPGPSVRPRRHSSRHWSLRCTGRLLPGAWSKSAFQSPRSEHLRFRSELIILSPYRTTFPKFATTLMGLHSSFLSILTFNFCILG
jgi:hypothetical protein